jgi:hypothetical protein
MFNFFIITPQLKICISNINYSCLYLEKYLFHCWISPPQPPAFLPRSQRTCYSKINVDLKFDLDKTGIQFNCLLEKYGVNINYGLRQRNRVFSRICGLQSSIFVKNPVSRPRSNFKTEFTEHITQTQD